MTMTMTTDAGYIYLIKSRILGGYKVGKTKNPDQRFSQLDVPKKATVVACWYTDQMSRLEKAVHKKFKSVRVPQSEWFDLSQDNLHFLCSVMSKHDTVWTSDEYQSYLPKPVATSPQNTSDYPVDVVRITTGNYHNPQSTVNVNCPSPEWTPKQLDKSPTPVVTTPIVTPVSSPETTDTPVTPKSLLDRLPSWTIIPMAFCPPVGLAIVGADCIYKAVRDKRSS
jgi:hypothetical protein